MFSTHTVIEQQKGELCFCAIFATAYFITLNPQESRKEKEIAVSTETIEEDLVFLTKG